MPTASTRHGALQRRDECRPAEAPAKGPSLPSFSSSLAVAMTNESAKGSGAKFCATACQEKPVGRLPPRSKCAEQLAVEMDTPHLTIQVDGELQCRAW